MPQTITRGYKALLEEANGKIETIPAAEAVPLHGRGDVVFVDLRDPRELDREGRIPGAFHCPRGMLEFWIDPDSPTTNRYSPRTSASCSSAPEGGARRWRRRPRRIWA
jgi:rhodanese-related sulfurtransferase